MTECGSIKVDSNLRVEGHANIFAIGDVNNIEEEKDMFSAKHQAKVACSNLIALLTGGVLTEYKAGGNHGHGFFLLFFDWQVQRAAARVTIDAFMFAFAIVIKLELVARFA